MDKKIRCFTCYNFQDFGYLTRFHSDCKIVGNSGSKKLYECTCCHKTFRGGLNGAIEWSDDMGTYDEYEELENFTLCTLQKLPFSWYIKQINILHHKYASDGWNYNQKMKPILLGCCNKFGLKANKFNFEKLSDVAIRKTKCIPWDIQKLIDNENEKNNETDRI